VPFLSLARSVFDRAGPGANATAGLPGVLALPVAGAAAAGLVLVLSLLAAGIALELLM